MTNGLCEASRLYLHVLVVKQGDLSMSRPRGVTEKGRHLVLADTIQLTVCSQMPGDLAGLIFAMDVFAGHKNPYVIYFPKTSSAGIATLSAADIRGQFRDCQESGMMDYDGTIESADQHVRLHLLDLAALRKNIAALRALPLLPHERTRWRSRDEQIEYALCCRNAEFEYVAPRSRFVLISPDGRIEALVRCSPHAET